MAQPMQEQCQESIKDFIPNREERKEREREKELGDLLHRVRGHAGLLVTCPVCFHQSAKPPWL